jgi:hypothetical protein
MYYCALLENSDFCYDFWLWIHKPLLPQDKKVYMARENRSSCWVTFE